MICTNTDHHVNTLSTIKKERKKKKKEEEGSDKPILLLVTNTSKAEVLQDVRRYSSKYVILKILQISQKNICVRVSFQLC